MRHPDDCPTTAVINIERRHLLAGAALLTVVPGTVHASDGLRWRSLSEVEATLTRLAAHPPSAHADGDNAGWSHGWGATLVHLAQSIEYSMHGFPQSKSPLFQRTIGAVAFAFFDARGRMSHDLNAPIPSAPAIDPATPAQAGMTRLGTAITAFRSWNAPLQPHFAYGVLDKAAYERAHAMHIAEHLQAWGVEMV